MDRVQAAIEKAHLLREKRQKEMKQALREHPPGGEKGFRWKGDPVVDPDRDPDGDRGAAPVPETVPETKAVPQLRLAADRPQAKESSGPRPVDIPTARAAEAGATSRADSRSDARAETRSGTRADAGPVQPAPAAEPPRAARPRKREGHGPLPQPPRYHIKPPLPGAAPAPEPAAEAPAESAPDPAAEESWPMAWDALRPFEPDPRHLRASRIVTFERKGTDHVPIDMIRTRMLRIMRENGWHTVVVTSPGPGCGKSTLVANLAFSLAHQSDTRTVLMDLDLRRPTQAKILGLSGRGTMAEVLTGAAPIEDSFQRYGDTLAVSTPGHAAGNPSEVLNSRAASITMKRIEAILAPEIILCDMPPMMRADDVMAFLPNIDCVLLVVAAEETKMAELDRCERELGAHTNVMGVVVNKCRYTPEEYGY